VEEPPESTVARAQGAVVYRGFSRVAPFVLGLLAEPSKYSWLQIKNTFLSIRAGWKTVLFSVSFLSRYT
jgi:hypothetical protein